MDELHHYDMSRCSTLKKSLLRWIYSTQYVGSDHLFIADLGSWLRIGPFFKGELTCQAGGYYTGSIKNRLVNGKPVHGSVFSKVV